MAIGYAYGPMWIIYISMHCIAIDFAIIIKLSPFAYAIYGILKYLHCTV